MAFVILKQGVWQEALVYVLWQRVLYTCLTFPHSGMPIYSSLRPLILYRYLAISVILMFFTDVL